MNIANKILLKTRSEYLTTFVLILGRGFVKPEMSDNRHRTQMTSVHYNSKVPSVLTTRIAGSKYFNISVEAQMLA